MWLFLSCLFVAANVVLTELNRVYRLPPRQLNFMLALVALLLLLGFTPFADWGQSGLFYLVAFLNGLASVACGAVLLSLAARQMSRVGSLYIPLSAFCAFVIWSGLHPYILLDELQRPLSFAFIIAGFALTTAAMMRMRRNDVTARAFLWVLPVGLTYGMLDVGIKLVMPETSHKVGDMVAAALAYNIVAFAAMALGSFLLLWQRCEMRFKIDRSYMKAALLGGVFSIISFGGLVLAISYAANPAYPALIGMTMPLWICVYHKLRGIVDPVKPHIAALFVAGAIFVVLGTL